MILVTGTAGFIGYHVAERLLEAGERVVGFDNFNDYYDPSLKEARTARLQRHREFEIIRGDLSDGQAVQGVFEFAKPELVIHLAAQAGVRYSIVNPKAYIDSNIVGFLNILEGCRHGKVKHLVYASSSSIYGGGQKMPYSTGDVASHPVSLYAATKRSNELMAHSYSHLYGLPTTGLRFFTVYGPWGRPDMAYCTFADKIVHGEPIDVYNHGKMKRDFTYIDDVVEALLAAAEKPASPNLNWDPKNPDPASSKAPFAVYNIGAHMPVDLLRMIEVLENCLGRRAIKRFLPMQPGDVLETFADVEPLTRLVGFSPKVTIEEGLSRFAEWYRAYHPELAQKTSAA